MKNELVVKHNDLVEARYNLSLIEQKIILLAVTKIDREENFFNFVEINVKEFQELLDTGGNRYEEIRKIVRGLRKKEIIIHTENKEYITGWLSSITFYKNSGKIKLRFDDDLMPYLLQLKNRFTRYQLKNILNLKNKYSIRIYELLKQYENIGKRYFEIDELKKILMLEGQYDRIYDFEKRVLEVSIEEINDYTDIIVDYIKKKRGRKIVGFTFEIQPEDKNEYIRYLEKNYSIKDIQKEMGLENENFNAKQIIDIYEKALQKNPNENIDIFKYVKINYLVMIEKGTAKNKFAYLMKALDEDYANATVILRYSNV